MLIKKNNTIPTNSKEKLQEYEGHMTNLNKMMPNMMYEVDVTSDDELRELLLNTIDYVQVLKTELNEKF